MRSFIYTCLCLFLLGENLLIGVNAADKGVVDKQATLKIITAPEVKEKLGKKDVFLVNSLTNIEYNIQHIPGSINIPLHDMDNPNLLPDNKHSTLIFYCMGGRCLYSRKASLKAIKLGYKNVFWFEGGIPDWYRFNYPMSINHQLKSISVKKLSPARIVDLLKQQSIFILDVKPEWWSSNEGAIKDSVHMPLIKLQHSYMQLPKDKAIIITDGLMRQSPSAARFLINKGYQILGVLKGGITRWEKEGYPVIKK